MNKILLKPLVNLIRHERGAVAVVVAITMVVMLAMAAGALDIGHALVARNELQNAADAGALAGARALGVIYEGMSSSAYASYTLSGADRSTIVTAAQTTAGLNRSAGVLTSVNAGDVQIGIWNSTTRTFTAATAVPRAVRVITRRDASTNGPISTFLARIIGMNTVSVTAVATAQLNAIGGTSPGALELPVSISEYFFSQFGCGDSIMLYPSNGTPQSCAGFTTFDQAPSNNATMLSTINGMINGTYQAPPTTAGVTQLQMTNGTLSNNTWNALVSLFQQKSAGTGYWDAFIPVYQGNACNPSGAITIKGYANIRITNIHGQPGATIVGNVQCPQFQSGGIGGGPSYGTFTTIPGLVE